MRREEGERSIGYYVHGMWGVVVMGRRGEEGVESRGWDGMGKIYSR